MVIGIGAIVAIQGAVNATIAAQNARKKNRRRETEREGAEQEKQA